MTVICELAKTGDCVSFLPIAKHIHDTEGESPVWVIHKVFAGVLRGVSYVVPHEIVFDARDVPRAVKLAKEMNPARIIVGSAHGKSYTGPRDRGYNYLSWHVNGFGEHFNDVVGFPLLFDKRCPEREANHTTRYVKTDRPMLLLSLSCAKSSPFPSREVFETSIRKRWGRRFHILNLCEIRSPRFYDLLGVMEKSALLITADTAHLHLATAAPNLKVVALVNDNPFLASETRYEPLYRVNYSAALEHLPRIHAAIATLLV